MALSGVGMAVAEEESVTWTLSILVRDVNGQPLHGAEITVKDITGELVYSGVSDASGQVETSVAMGTYAVRATDPANRLQCPGNYGHAGRHGDGDSHSHPGAGKQNYRRLRDKGGRTILHGHVWQQYVGY